jgi:hypothetical protein
MRTADPALPSRHAHSTRSERERQLLDGIQEFLLPVPIYLNLIQDFAALGDVGGVQYAMSNLLACIRAAEATKIELDELCNSSTEAA